MLNRMEILIYSEDDIGKSKIEVATQFLKKINSDIIIIGIDEKITNKNADFLLNDFDIIIDCLDNF